MKSVILLFTFLLASASIAAQQNITGTVTDRDSGQTLPYASVIVTDTLQQIITTVQTDDNGHFSVAIPTTFNNGILTIRYIGYDDYIQKTQENKFPLVIKATLKPTTTLKEVVIKTKQNAVTSRGDKMIYNIQMAGIGAGNNGLETLQQLPGIRLDKDENLLFRGNGDIQIMINGKKSSLQGEALREFIRSLKGDDIASVEIIAQPSARYDASGTAGIINIVLKQKKEKSLSGNAYAWASYGEYFKHQYGGRIYYSDSLWNINGNTSYYKGNSVNHRHITQNIVTSQGIRTIDQTNEWLPETTSKNLNLAIERKLSKKQLISTDWQYYRSDSDEETYGATYESLNGSAVNTVKLTQHLLKPTERITGNIFYNFTNDSITTKLDVQANLARYTTSSDGYLRNDYPDQSYMQLNGNNNTRYTILTAQSDLRQRLIRPLHLETGFKYSYINMDYYNRYNTNNSGLLIIPDSLLTNDFTYKEHLTSAYAQLELNLDKWNIMAGLRAEHYQYEAVSFINHQSNTDSYINFFPSFSINYKEGNNRFQIGYSRRIGRPGYLSLNPYYLYLDAYTLQKGNPALKPQFYHSFQLGYIYKNALNLSLYGYLYKNGFINVIDYQEDRNYNVTYEANAATGKKIGFSASYPYSITPWWSMQLTAEATYSSESSDIPGFQYSGNGFRHEINLSENLTLKNDWTINVNGFYAGRSTVPNGYSKAIGDFSISAKKNLLNKKIQLSGGCTNILRKSLYHKVTEVQNVTTDWTNRWETRRFYLQATYYFGGGKSKTIKAASLNEETNRM
ncbi:outer membrane beta-barrel family protein [Flavobacterium cerinum]|uniref:TonB-dependent receptor n=1 Tax=Flavobacterium cerinum TaxID=2502784 RepID=A0ABY5IVP4_9FLAO|nr:outer membrane beta-barrel family protein [Flavobacterium cerinum]UUC46898.1 TonB-dependent receptor [Flavobacterium cerinum]